MIVNTRTPAGTFEVIPRRAVLAGGLVGATVLALTAAARWSGRSAAVGDDAPVVAQRTLRCVDLPGGDVDVRDGATGALLQTLHGEQGFIRGALRGVLRDRKRRGLGAQTPLVLAAHADGRLMLSDPLSGERIDLQSFGAPNAAQFARWLDRPAATPTKAMP